MWMTLCNLINICLVYFQGMKARQVLIDMIEKKAISANPNGISLLDKIMQHNKQMSSNGEPTDDTQLDRAEITDITLELLYASQETLASILCTILIHLAKPTRVLDDIRRELIDHGIGKEDVLSYDVIQSLTYVNDVMKEALRLVPPVAGCFRKTTKPLEVGVSTLGISDIPQTLTFNM